MAEIQVPTDAPAHICAELLRVIDLEASSDGRYLDELERQVQEGQITQADAERKIDEFPESSRDKLLGYCRDNCGTGRCAMTGFGTELVDAEESTLTDEEKAKLSFFVSVDVIRFTGKMSLGIPPL